MKYEYDLVKYHYTCLIWLWVIEWYIWSELLQNFNEIEFPIKLLYIWFLIFWLDHQADDVYFIKKYRFSYYPHLCKLFSVMSDDEIIAAYSIRKYNEYRCDRNLFLTTLKGMWKYQILDILKVNAIKNINNTTNKSI